MRKHFLCMLALISVFALALMGCGSQEAVETTASVEAPALGVQDFRLSASTWSSPNGATIHLTATPFGYAEGYSAAFVVMLDGEEVAHEPCAWDGSAYTASAELNAADGLGYYVLMTAADGNTMTVPLYEAEDIYVNLASSLESYCHLIVDASEFGDNTLTITSGTVQIQVPRITNDGETITASRAELILTHNGETIATADLLNLPAGEAGLYTQQLPELAFEIPELAEDEQVILQLHVTLSNGQTLQTLGGTFFYNDGQLLTAVG